MNASPVAPSNIVASPTHPLLLAAAASVTLLCLAGVGTLAGWLPGPASRAAEPTKLASAAPPVTAATPISVQQTVNVPPAKPAARTGDHAAPSAHRAAPVAVTRAVPANVSQPTRSPIPETRSEPAPNYPPPTFPASAALPPVCRECGVVQSVTEVAVEPKTSVGGAIAGGVVGGIIGNQWGRGSTRDIATVLGALGGAYAGNRIEKSVKESKRYDVVVRFEDGSTRTFSSDTPPAWHSGDRVMLQNGLLTMGGGRSGGGAGLI